MANTNGQNESSEGENVVNRGDMPGRHLSKEYDAWASHMREEDVVC